MNTRVEVIAAEPKLLNCARGRIRLLVFCEVELLTCLVRVRRWCISSTRLLFEQTVEVRLSYLFPHHSYCDITLKSRADEASHVSLSVSSGGQFSDEAGNLICFGELWPSDIALAMPQVLQANSNSSVIIAIHHSTWLASILPLLIQSSRLTVRVTCETGDSMQKLICGACLQVNNPYELKPVDRERSEVIAYLESYLFRVPECNTAHLEVSLDGTHFVRCGPELHVLPSFTIIHTLPPILNSMDTAGLVVLCSASAPLVPVSGRFPDTLPKCWCLELSSWRESAVRSDMRTNKMHVGPILAKLPVILSQPRKEEIDMLDCLSKFRRRKYDCNMHSNGPKPFSSLGLTIKSAFMRIVQACEFAHRFASCPTEVMIDVSCHDARQSMCLGHLWPSAGTGCQTQIEFPQSTDTSIPQHVFAAKSFEITMKHDSGGAVDGISGDVELHLPIAARSLADIAKSVLDLCVVVKKQINEVGSIMVSEIVACGRVPVSIAELNEKVPGFPKVVAVNLDACHPLCNTCTLDLFLSASDLMSVSPADTQSISVYAFRSCGVQITKHNIQAHLLVNLRATSEVKIGARYESILSETSAKNHCGLLSSHWHVHAFDKQDWVIQEATPHSGLVERETRVELCGSGFKHAFEASLRVCIQLEDGRILETVGALADENTILFKTPSVPMPQMSNLRVAFDFGKTTLWSNPVEFTFFPYPKLFDHWPPFLPNSAGGTLSLHGDAFCEADFLRVFLFSPVETIKNDLTESILTAADEYSSLARNAMKPGIAPAFAAAMQARAAGGSSAAAAAAAGATSVTTASGGDFENIDAVVSDTVRAMGGTKRVAMAASRAAVYAANFVSRNAPRDKSAETHRFESPGAMSELIAEEAAGSRLESDISLNGTAMDGQPSLFGYCPHLLVSLDHDDDGNRYIEVASHHVSSQKINCVVPPNLPVLKIHAALSKTQGQDETRVVCLFTVGGIWPVCGEATGGTLVRISGINFDSVFKFSQSKNPRSARSTGPPPESASIPASIPSPPLLARTQSFLPRVSKPLTNLGAVRQSNNSGQTGHNDHVPPSLSSSHGQSKLKNMRRTMSVRLVNEAKVAQNSDSNPAGYTGNSGRLDAHVLFKLNSPTTSRILHRTMVKGTISRLSATQILSTGSAGASAFAALAGTGDSLHQRDSGLWGGTTLVDPSDCAASTAHPSTAVGIAAAEHAAKVLGPECVVQCRTPPCPLALLLNASSFIAMVEVSFSGPDGQFSCDNVQYEYVRPLTLKVILPHGDHLVPGHSVLLLKGHSIVGGKAPTLHMNLLAAPEGGTSTFGHVRTLERLALSYKIIQRHPISEDGGANGNAGGDDLDPEKMLTQVCAAMPFFVRRRYFNCPARCVPTFARETVCTSSDCGYPDSSGNNLHTLELRLWVHSQPVAADMRQRLDSEAPTLDNLTADKAIRTRRTSVRRQKSSSPQRQLLRQLSRTESFKHSGNSLVRQLSDLAEPSRRLGRISSQRLIPVPQNASRTPAERFKRTASQFRLGERQLSRSGIGKQATESTTRRNLRQRNRGGFVDNGTSHKSTGAPLEPDCLVNEINIELSPNGQDWTDRASRRLQLASPHSLTRIEPALGPALGGSALLIHGDGFPTINETCIVGFLCLGSCLIPTRTQVVELRGRNAAGINFLDVSIASLESHAAARKIQAILRGRLLRAFAKNGIPCVCVTGVVVSPKAISCIAPAVLACGRADVVISFDGADFEWAPSERLRQLRIAHLLLELGIGADDASAAAAAISSGILNEESDHVQPDIGSASSGLPSFPSDAQSTSENVALVVSPESAIFETRLHLAFGFYTPPWLWKVNYTRAPFTDVLELIGGQFLTVRHAIVRFEFDPSDNKHANSLLTEKLDVSGNVEHCQMVKCATPSALPSGRDVKVSVSTNGGHDFSGRISYVVNKCPVLNSLRPSCGPRSGGTAIFIHGQNFVSKALDVKVRFSLANGDSSTPGGIGQKLCTVSAIRENSGTIKCRLPPFEQLLSHLNCNSHKVLFYEFISTHATQQLQVTEADDDEIPNSTRTLAGNINADNSIISLWVDVCILGGSVFTGKPLLFLLYDHFPKLIRMRPHSGALSGGYKVNLMGSGFLKTNSITARIIPLPSSLDIAATMSRRSNLAKLLGSKRQRRRGAVLDQRSVPQRTAQEVQMADLGSMSPVTSVGNKPTQVRPVAVRCRYHSDTEVSFKMPWLLGRQPGPFLVQVSLNSSEFSEPHERCIFHLFYDHRSRDREHFPRPTGPQDLNTSRVASRKLHQLNVARHRRLAQSDAGARNNNFAHLYYLLAVAQPHEAQPSIRSIIRAAVAEVDEKGVVDMSEVVSLARMQEVPIELLKISIPSFDRHPLFREKQTKTTNRSSRIQKSVAARCRLSLIEKLRRLLRDQDARKNLLSILNEAFFLLARNSGRIGITYAELCEQLMLVHSRVSS